MIHAIGGGKLLGGDVPMSVAQVLPSGLVVPGLPYLLTLLTLSVAVGALVYFLEPPLSQWFVVAIAPWTVVGGAFHAFYQIDAYPAWAAPIFSAPSVYLTTFVVMGTVWLGATFIGRIWDNPESTDKYLGGAGLGFAVVLVAFVFWQSLAFGGPQFVWPTIAFLLSGMITVGVYIVLGYVQTEAVSEVGVAGAIVVFGHVLDGISTAIGIDVLGTTERSPIPAMIMDVAGRLPTADLIGTGWLFVVVKILVAALVVALFADFADEHPRQGFVTLAFIAGLGFGPASNNLLLFIIGA